MEQVFSSAPLPQVDLVMKVFCHPLKFWTQEQLRGVRDLNFQSTLALVQWFKIL
jgi:hypothetical protein